jgi:hypothetical protein
LQKHVDAAILFLRFEIHRHSRCPRLAPRNNPGFQLLDDLRGAPDPMARVPEESL